jgi:hypothetical protein
MSGSQHWYYFRTANHSRGILDRVSMLNGPPPPDFKVGGSWPRWSSPAGTQADHSILKSGGGSVEYGYTVENTDKHAENMYAPTAAPDVPMCGVAIRGVPGLLLSLYSDSSKLVRP